MTSYLKKIFFVLMLIIFQNLARAQDGEYLEVSDLESWTSLAVKYNLNKKWNFGLQEQMRLDNNSTELKGFLTELSTRYNFNKNIGLGLGLRMINKNDNEGNQQGYEHYFRYHFDGIYKHKLDRFSMNYRLRYQNRNDFIDNGFEMGTQKEYLRLRVKMGYNIRNWKLDPQISGELFNEINSQNNNTLSHYRISLGTDYKLKGMGKVGLYYRMEKEINAFYPKTTHIIRAKYTYTFKHK